MFSSTLIACYRGGKNISILALFYVFKIDDHQQDYIDTSIKVSRGVYDFSSAGSEASIFILF
jgi:hypothetical protein